MFAYAGHPNAARTAEVVQISNGTVYLNDRMTLSEDGFSKFRLISSADPRLLDISEYELVEGVAPKKEFPDSVAVEALIKFTSWRYKQLFK